MVRPTTEELSKLLHVIHEHHKANTLDSHLMELNLQSMNHLTILAYARYTYPYRSKLVRWTTFINFVRNEFQYRDLPPTLLRGLFDG